MDHTLGAYPLQPPTQYRKWVALTRYITQLHVETCLGPEGRVDMDTPLLPSDEAVEYGFRPIQLKQSVPPHVKDALGTMQYTEDKGWLLRETLQQRGGMAVLLGEMQLAFVCLLVAQNYDGFSHWKTLLHLVLSSSIRYNPDMTFFIHFLGTIELYLKRMDGSTRKARGVAVSIA